MGQILLALVIIWILYKIVKRIVNHIDGADAREEAKIADREEHMTRLYMEFQPEEVEDLLTWWEHEEGERELAKYERAIKKYPGRAKDEADMEAELEVEFAKIDAEYNEWEAKFDAECEAEFDKEDEREVR